MEKLKKLFKGRLNRLHYFLGQLIIYGVATPIIIVYHPNNYLYPNSNNFLLLYLIFFLTITLTLPLIIRRLHDIGISGFLAPI